MQLIAVLIIGAILLIIIGAFVFSSSFRKDVIASEGEASILGLFNVKGVLIILLTAIFCGTFIYILREDMPEILAQNKLNSQPKQHSSIQWTDLENGGKKIIQDSVAVCEVNPLIGATCLKRRTDIGKIFEVDGISNFYFRIDSAQYVYKNKSSYRFDVVFGEKNKSGEILWLDMPKTLYKTLNGNLDEHSQFTDVSDSRWKRQYKVIMTIGQPNPEFEFVDLVYLIVASWEVDVRR